LKQEFGDAFELIQRQVCRLEHDLKAQLYVPESLKMGNVQLFEDVT
jgi:hypothetical protein